ncbi:MAG: molecular chaperone DnaJ, partial [Flavobacteriales bacterium]|nr:molecular chaperone DnaJ [Flavobacteriales bacterium]
GLEEGASKAEIEKKYKELSKEYDPKNNDNQESRIEDGKYRKYREI